MTIAMRGVPDAALKDIADFAAKFFFILKMQENF